MVWGVEGDGDWSNIKGSTTSTLCPLGCSTSNTWLATARGRLGYAADRWMPYITGGAAFGDIRASTPSFSGTSTNKTGWTIGGGVEVALVGNWTAKAEYLYVDLGDTNCGLSCGLTANNNVVIPRQRRSRRHQLPVLIFQDGSMQGPGAQAPGPFVLWRNFRPG